MKARLGIVAAKVSIYQLADDVSVFAVSADNSMDLAYAAQDFIDCAVADVQVVIGEIDFKGSYSCICN
ncbi:MAG TPA: hypothetical protein DEA85_01285 [Firmicutes bacterium]|nr:hypothetical protein [Bacillota bacterium]